MDRPEGVFELDYISNSFDLFAKEIITLLQYEVQIEDFDEYITNSCLVGPPGAHSRENILGNIKKLVQKQQSGKDGDYDLCLPKMSFDEMFNAAIKICGNNSDPDYIEGEDFVSLEAFKVGLRKAVSAAADIKAILYRVDPARTHPVGGILPVCTRYFDPAVFLRRHRRRIA